MTRGSARVVGVASGVGLGRVRHGQPGTIHRGDRSPRGPERMASKRNRVPSTRPTVAGSAPPLLVARGRPRRAGRRRRWWPFLVAAQGVHGSGQPGHPAHLAAAPRFLGRGYFERVHRRAGSNAEVAAGRRRRRQHRSPQARHRPLGDIDHEERRDLAHSTPATDRQHPRPRPPRRVHREATRRGRNDRRT